ncbi:MAG: SgcJ/EcaC family oxidoreductase [Hyphomicrobiaceae bacterium]|nr:SgcJ/EcaC family oxidoreductase [Hyphomicrobiaceae bacterium]
MNSQRSLKTLLLVTAIAVVLVAPVEVRADENCCFNNFRFAGGCMVVARGSETCGSIQAYLNNFNAVGKFYCDNTMVRGGWTLSDCGDPAQLQNQNLTPQFAEPAEPVQQRQRSMRSVQPQTAPAAQDATLIKLSAPLNVRFDGSIDSDSQGAGQLVTGTLEEDLMSGDTVLAPAGSQVQARLVPTSYWTDGGGDAFQIQATAIKVGDTMVPVNAKAVAATGGIDTSGAEISVPKGSLVSFETQAANQHAADKRALEAGAAAWMEAFNTRNADALASLYAEDAVLLPPNEPAVFGRDAIRATNRELLAEEGLGMELEDLEVKIVGDLGYKAGRYRMYSKDGGLLDRGKYIEIWKKTNGTWLIHRDMWNSSVAAPAESEPAE